MWTQQKMQDSQNLKKQSLYIYISVFVFMNNYFKKEVLCVCVFLSNKEKIIKPDPNQCVKSVKCGMRIISERKLLHIGFHQRKIKITFLANDSTALLR